MKIRLEKIDTHEGVTVKALLDSGATGMFVDRKFAEKHGFKMDKLEKPLVVTNVDGSNNSGGRITHKIECNVYYRGHQERMKFDVCNLERTDVILGMPWLAAHNPEIDWEKGEVKMTMWGFTDKGLYCNTDLCCDHKFRRQLCTKEFKGEVNKEMGRVIKMGIELRSFISKS